MASIEFQNVTKKFGDNTVISSMNLTIEDGSFTVLVGPSGCGKTTLLRMIAGIGPQTSGRVLVGGRDVTDIEPGKRGVAMVFQNYAIYPTMTVRENISFGLKNIHMPKETIDKRVKEACSKVGMMEYLDRKPSTLSGGQRQRIALARAIVKNPEVFLMDEPLSNLDAKLRVQMRVELIELHKKLKTTFVYVTHDQVEAMSMADTIVLMDGGRIQQMASPSVMYKDPDNLFTARFIGSPSMNIRRMDDSTSFGFRPENASIGPEKEPNAWFTTTGTITAREMLGSETLYTIRDSAGNAGIRNPDGESEAAALSKSGKHLFRRIRPYLMIAPAVFGIVVFTVIPAIQMVVWSFYDINQLNPAKTRFIGFGNYTRIFQSADFTRALVNTGVYTFWTVVVIMALAILLAVWLGTKRDKLSKFTQAAIFLPYIVSMVSIGLIFLQLMSPNYGLFNTILDAVGLPKSQWTQSSKTAMMSVILVAVWKAIGYYTIIIGGALQAVPTELYEAAALDNSGKVRTLLKITIPIISPQLFFVLIIMTIGSFKVFETIQIMTGGGPNNATSSLVYYIYMQVFSKYDIGRAAAGGVVLLIIVGVLTFVYFRLLSRKVHYQ